MNPQLMTVTGMIVAATALTLIPHPPNFSPAGAIALFAGASLGDKRMAFAVPLTALLLRDIIVGLHVLMPFVYASYALSVCLGFCVQRYRSAAHIAFGSIAGSCLFFLITNFGVWRLLDTFPPNLAGLAACYIAGIPYFTNTVAGDLLYSAVLFGTLALGQRHFTASRAHA